ncbi:MAG: hypothetical protein HY556_09450 [Euryarchaeota archaeon]|nr:hypothetical protein [Euryarchaeota archaeon]
MLARSVLVLAALVVSGCVTGPPAEKDDVVSPPAILPAVVPWWEVGDWWLVDITNSTGATYTSRLVNFWNDTETAHFWLGVQDRDEAMEHALFDTNPLLGRIHHAILTPHEKGMHASMYRFPIVDNETWEGFSFGAQWSYKARAVPDIATPLGVKEGYRITGFQPNGARIDYDYVPALKWFSSLVQRDSAGREVLELVVKGHGSGSTGTYVFLQGRDFFKGPTSADATHDETFEVKEDTTFMAVKVDVRSERPWRLDLVDPTGTTRATFSVLAANGGQWQELKEVPAMQGVWTWKYISAAPWAGKALATGINEFTKTI